MRETNTLLYLHALTSLHPGSGAALGAIDLPVQRERHTQWPVISGSSLKGVMRDSCRSELSGTEGDKHKADIDPMLAAAFGPPTTNGDAHSGALSISDARILAFPVRSLKGVFAWVTCNAVLDRFIRDFRLVSGEANAWTTTPVTGKQVLVAESSPLLFKDGNDDVLVIEEFDFERLDSLPEFLSTIATAISTDPTMQARFKSHTVILPDDYFGHLVRYATEVAARIALDYETKTATGKALFYEESLPTETVFYSLVQVSPSRKKELPVESRNILEWVKEKSPRVLQLGGDATIGKGFCEITFGTVGGNS